MITSRDLSLFACDVVKQGGHVERITEYFRHVAEAARHEFTEDNYATIHAMLEDCFKESLKQEFNISVRCKRGDWDFDELSDRLYEAGFDDSLVSGNNTHIHLDVDRLAMDKESAIKEIQKQLHVVGLEIEEIGGM